MKKRYVLAICLAAALRLQAQTPPNTSGFGPQQVIFESDSNRPRDVYTADLDGDGDQDVLSASIFDDNIAWYENDRSGSFGEQQVITTQADGAVSVYAADLDGDGDQDVLSASLDNNITWYENDGSGSFGEQQVITTLASDVKNIYATDLDGDGDQDVLSASVADTGDDILFETDTGKVAWYENDGAGNFGEEQVIITQPSDRQLVYAADLDGDGDQDVLSISLVDYSSNRLVWYENDGSGSFGEEQVITTRLRGINNSLYVADLDGDGDQDVLSFFSDLLGTGGVVWYENDGTVNFGEQQVIQSGDGDGYVTDLDDDGDQDVLSDFGNEIAWYENDGSGNFGEEQAITTQAEGANSIYAADLDGDGDQDVLAALGDKITWYENQLSEPSATAPSITALSLFNARTDNPVQPLTDGLVLDLLSPEPNLYDYNVAAEVEARGQTTTRVTFELDAPDAANQDTVRTEQKTPYVLFGHLGQDFREVQAYAGDYTLTATPYYQDSTGAEVAGTGQTVSFTFVTPNMDIREPRLIDAASEQVIESLEAGDMISLAPDQPVGVQVDTRFPEFNSVEFFLDGPSPDGQVDVQRLENASPYSLFGDGGAGTVPDGQPLAEGEYELRVIAYLGKNRDGYAGPDRVIPFSVVHEASEGESLAYPVPFVDEFNLRVGAVDLSQTRIQLVHSYGRVYEVSSSQLQVTEEGLRINVAHLPTGPYTIHVQQAGGMQTFRGSKQ